MLPPGAPALNRDKTHETLEPLRALEAALLEKRRLHSP
jgi:hypothetical protein